MVTIVLRSIFVIIWALASVFLYFFLVKRFSQPPVTFEQRVVLSIISAVLIIALVFAIFITLGLGSILIELIKSPKRSHDDVHQARTLRKLKKYLSK